MSLKLVSVYTKIGNLREMRDYLIKFTISNWAQMLSMYRMVMNTESGNEIESI
jgi:hypothetical protein